MEIKEKKDLFDWFCTGMKIVMPVLFIIGWIALTICLFSIGYTILGIIALVILVMMITTLIGYLICFVENC